MFELYTISVTYRDFANDTDTELKVDVCGRQSALEVAEQYRKAMNTQSVIMYDAFTGEIIYEFDPINRSFTYDGENCGFDYATQSFVKKLSK